MKPRSIFVLAVSLLPLATLAAPLPVKEVTATELAARGRVYAVTDGRAEIGGAIKSVEVAAGKVVVVYDGNASTLPAESDAILLLVNRFGMHLAPLPLTGRLRSGPNSGGALERVELNFTLPNLEGVLRPAGVEIPADWRTISYVILRKPPTRPANSATKWEPPVPRNQPPPEFPRGAPESGGEVIVSFTIDVHGDVVSPTVVKSTDKRFEAAALAAVARWKYEPSLRNGVPVERKMALPIVFAAR